MSMHITCERAVDAFLEGTATSEDLAHLAECSTCQGFTNMARTIRIESEPVPTRPGQRPQWINELHARIARRRSRVAIGGLLSLGTTIALALIVINVRYDDSRYQKSAVPARPSMPVGTAVQSFAGVLRVRTTIEVSASDDDTVAEVYVEVGDHVHPGMRLVSFDDGHMAEELARAEADLGRREVLISREEAIGWRSPTTRAERTRELEAARAHVRDLRRELAKMHINVPVAAMVLDVYVRPGQAVTAGTPLLKLGDPHDLAAEIRIPEDELGTIEPGQEREIVSDESAATIRGVIRSIEHHTEGTAIVTVDISVPEDSSLRPGAIVHMK